MGGGRVAGDHRKDGSESGRDPVRGAGAEAPLQHILFDQSGRLWVQRSVADTAAMAEADVYSKQGRLVDAVRCPRDIDLKSGTIREDAMYGIRGGSETPPRLVRLRY